ncbi:MAG TPA: outer membrane lipoprotein carrier protein LolA [Trueperaceae bacterium]|nr:outer membrane lipoprotein carrier protein LolA [Trueperaceae bacterium]
MQPTSPHPLGTPARALARTLAMLLALTVAAVAGAQQPSVDTVLGNIENAANAIKDATFTVTGKLVDSDGTVIPLNVDIQAIPPKHIASAYINQPDALADNQIVLDGNVVKNYTFLTNQITLFDANDPDALGGLLPAGTNGQSSPVVSFDLKKIFEGYDASIQDVKTENGKKTYILAFKNKDPKANILDVTATVPASDWLPRELVFKQKDGKVVADLKVNGLKLDQGLDPKKVTYLPQDAQVIDNRKK